MEQLLTFLKTNYTMTNVPTTDRKKVNRYPIEAMIRIVYILNELQKDVTKTMSSAVPNFKKFPTNEGLIKVTYTIEPSTTPEQKEIQDKKQTEYNSVLEVINKYMTYMESLKLRNDIDPGVSKNDINYQLIEMHTLTGKVGSKAILQLIRGADIQVDQTILNKKIEALIASGLAGLSNTFRQLKTQMNEFFQDKDTSIYIIYQESPVKLLTTEKAKIKQLGQIECLIATVDSINVDKVSRKPIFNYADNDMILSKISAETQKRSKKDNKFADFGITIKGDVIQLVDSITQMTGTLLNAAYIDEKSYFKVPAPKTI